MSQDQTPVSEPTSEGASPDAAPARPRRRRRAKSEARAEADQAQPADAPAVVPAPVADAATQPDATEQVAAPRRRRGRPRKSESAQPEAASHPASAPEAPSVTKELADQPPQGQPARAQAPEAARPAQPQASQPAQQAHQGSHQAQGGRQGQGQGGQGGQGGQSHGKGNQRNRRNRRQGQAEVANEPSLSRERLQGMLVAELRAQAAELGVEYVGLRKAELVEAVYEASARAEGFRSVEGVLEIGPEGYGWVRTGTYMEGDDDAFVHQQLIRSLGLRPGDKISGTVGPGKANSKYPPLKFVASVNGRDPETMRDRPRFRDLTPVYPDERLVLEHGKDSITGRAIDLVSPIGKGQRGLIVSPPKAGKTTVLKRICQSIAANNPEVHLFCLLVDERPEEVTDMQRSIKGEVVASTFDMPAENHTHVAELVIEHAKRLVELGEDVVVVLDSITRLARAYNLAAPASGRILSGGVDSAALYPPKKFLGAARNIEHGGSLTIIASALVDTGSKMDEVIFEEFKGTGNMELKLDRDLADKRIFPAIDPVASGTRNEDLLIPGEYQPLVWGIRRVLANMNNTERAANALVKGLRSTSSNEEFLIRSAKKAAQTDYVA